MTGVHTETNKRIWSEFVPDYVDERVGRILEILPRLALPARYLDIGCSSGTTTRLCADAMGTTDVHGVDLTNVETARSNGVTAIAFDLNSGRRLPYEAGSFAVVTCLETLEHLADPDFVLTEIRRLLSPEGVAVVDVPRLDSWMNVLLLALGYQLAGVECSTRRRYGAINEGSLLTGHVSYFTRRAFLEMVEAHGLTTDRFEQVGQASNWLEVQKKLGRKVGVVPRVAWWLYDRLPWKKDYMILRLHTP